MKNMKRIITMISSIILILSGSLPIFHAQEYKDTINVAMTAEPPSMDPPRTVANVALNIGLHIYETLYTMDEEFNPQPMLAEGYEVNDDMTEYTFTLRQGVKFHNGEEMKASDVAASMNYWLNTSDRAKNLLKGGNFEVVDDYTVKASFSEPAKDLVTIMASRPTFPAIRPKAAIDAAGDNGVTEYIGTGPYRFEDWKHDQYVHLVANEDYQPREEEPSGYAGRREPLTQNIYYHIVPDSGTRVAGILSGTYDIAEDIPSDNYEMMESNPDLQILTSGGGTLVASLNVTEGPLADLQVRRAIEMGIDNDAIGQAGYGNSSLFDVNPNYMNPDHVIWGEVPALDYYNKKDVEGAKKLLAESSYNGEEIVLLTTPDYLEMYNATVALQQQLTNIGINAKIDAYDFPTFMERKEDTSNWDIFITSNGYQVLPQQVLSLTPSWSNATDETFIEKIELVKEAVDEAEQKAAYHDLLQFIYNDYISSNVFAQYKSFIVANKNIEGLTYLQMPFLWNTQVTQ